MAENAARETAEALGATMEYQSTDSDNIKFQDYAMNFADQGYDGIFLSHGNKETSYDLVKTLVDDYGMKVVTFDTQFQDEAGNPVTIEGVTQMFQDDGGMAGLLLDYALQVMHPEKKTIDVLKIWRGPGISPFDRRQATYVKYEENGSVNTLEVIAPSDPKNGESSMTEVMAATLPKYPEGSIDVVWSCYDAYARGAYTAISEANRTDVKIVSVDISNQDINFMLDESNIWLACATVDFTTVGQQGMRLLAMKMKGDATEDWYELTPSLVTYDQLNENSNVLNLGEVVDGYGVNNDHIADWMAPYIPKK